MILFLQLCYVGVLNYFIRRRGINAWRDFEDEFPDFTDKIEFVLFCQWGIILVRCWKIIAFYNSSEGWISLINCIETAIEIWLYMEAFPALKLLHESDSLMSRSD